MKKTLCLLLTGVLCFPLLLCGCTGSGNKDTTTQPDTSADAPDTTTEAPDITTVTPPEAPSELSAYSIVRPENDRFGELAAAQELKEGIASLCGAELKLDNEVDQMTNPDGDPYFPMILVGNTTLEETQTVVATFASAKDYAIRFTDTNKIVITGGCLSSTLAAVRFFLDKYVSAASGTLTMRRGCAYTAKHAAETDNLSVVSLNLRTANGPTINTQAEREPLIVRFISENKPDSLGTQECEPYWRMRLDAKLTELGYARAQEVPANGGVTKNYIWYNTETLTLVDAGVFWLSETPETSSMGFGSKFYISCCWAIFEVKATGAHYVHMNTHLNVDSFEIRKQEIGVLNPRIQQYLDAGKAVIVTGDFNSTKTSNKDDPNSEIYNTMTSLLSDARLLTKNTTSLGTFNDMDYNTEYYGPIDYCFINPDFTVSRYAVIDKIDGKFMSDHNAVLVEFSLFKK